MTMLKLLLKYLLNFNKGLVSNNDEFSQYLIFKIYFSSLSAAIKARDNLNNRFFGGRRVSASIYDQTLFDDHDLSG